MRGDKDSDGLAHRIEVARLKVSLASMKKKVDGLEIKKKQLLKQQAEDREAAKILRQ